MISNYIITSYRFIVKSKTYTILNLAGLVAGLTASFILLIFTLNELSYDRYHAKEDRTYRVISRETFGDQYSVSQFTLGPLLDAKMQGVESTARITFPGFITGSVKISGSGVFNEEPQFACADQSLLQIFDIEIINGNRDNCLVGNDRVILSDRAAKKYFGDINPLGRTLRMKTSGAEFNLRVMGVFRSFPWNSTLQADVISGIHIFPMIMGSLFDSADLVRTLGNDATVETFVLLKSSASLGSVQGQIRYFIHNAGLDPQKAAFSLQPLQDIYLGSGNINDLAHKKGNRATMYIYLALALFVLLLAGINYSILSTARSALRYREIGVRKVLGASRGALSTQVLTESVLLTFLSFPLSYLLLGLSEPLLQWIFGYRVEVYSAGTFILIPLFAGITLFIGLVSGIYIAFYLSSLNPIDALKNKLSSHKKINLSRVFIVFQLLITLTLLITVITVYRQVNFCLNSDLGVEKRNLAVIPFDPNEFKSVQELKAQIGSLPEVVSIAGSSILPPDIAINTLTIKLNEKDKPVTLESVSVDAGFFRTMGIEVLAGTDFDPRDPQTSRQAFIVNEEAAKMLGIKNLKKVYFAGKPVIAIVRNFNIHTMYTQINPTLFLYKPEATRALVIRYREGTVDGLRMKAGRIWDRLAPGMAFDFRNFTGELTLMYTKEKVFGMMVAAFATLALIIMGMGLFGLAILISERKTKETAIRKVFGATNVNILFGMQKEFLWYIGIASSIAIPSTIFLLHIWLDTFYYRITMSWWIFVVATLGVTIFVSSIILIMTLRVLRENPAKALKYE